MSGWVVEPCPVGWGIDTAGSDTSPGGVLTPAWLATAAADERLDWRPTHVARYLAPSGTVRTHTVAGGDVRGCWSISRRELEAVAGSGLHLRLVQFPVDWWRRLDATLGELLGAAAVTAREALGLPPGGHLWCNWEGRQARYAGASASYAFLDTWSRAVVRGGDRAGLYVGDDSVPLLGPALYRLPHVSSYWGGVSAWRNPAMSPDPRGWAIRQRAPSVLHGLTVDWDECRVDGRGETPMGYRCA
jgi:hypothetical protein